MPRLLYASVFLLMGLTEQIMTYFRVPQNAFNLLAAAAGALVIRFAWPRLPVRASLGGWLVGFLLACMFGTSIHKAGIFHLEDMAATWGAVALLGDMIIQLVGWVIRLLQPIGTYTIEHPAEAFDGTMERVEKVAGVWIRVKAPVLSFFNFIKSVIPHKQ